MATSFGPQTHFDHVLSDYLAGLAKKPKKRLFFERIRAHVGNTKPSDLLESIKAQADNCAKQPLRRVFTGHLLPLMQQLERYGSVMDNMAQAQPSPISIIWGSIRAVIIFAKEYDAAFSSIVDELDEMDLLLRKISTCEVLYGKSPQSAEDVQVIIGRVYVSILDFWWKAVKYMQKPQTVQFLRSAAKDSKLANVIDKLRKDVRRLQNIAEQAEVTEQNQTRNTVEQISYEVKEMKNQDRVQAETQRRRFDQVDQQLFDSRWIQYEMRRQSLLDQVQGDIDDQSGVVGSMAEQRHQGTCEWLFQTAQFQDWIAAGTSQPIFWLHGKHGAGKSFLCASTIEHVRSAVPRPFVAFRLMMKGVTTTRLQFLRSIAWQLLRCYDDEFGDIPEPLARLIHSCSTDPRCFEGLIRHLLGQDHTYIFIDGLDESAEEYELLQALVQFFTQLARNGPKRLRLWFSSVYSQAIADSIKYHGGDAVIDFALETHHTKTDMESYLAANLPNSVRQRSALVRTMIQGVVMTEVEGSFLWANAMMQDMKSTVKDDEESYRLAATKLPKTMTAYYSYVLDRYEKSSHSGDDPPLWKIVLSLVMFCERPLKIVEVQEAIAIFRTRWHQDLNVNRLVHETDIRNICPSLIRVTKGGQGAWESLLLQHSAVHSFLLEHSDTSTSKTNHHPQYVSHSFIRDCCMRYLLQPRFASMLQKMSHSMFLDAYGERIEKHYFLLYATKYWYRHCDKSSLSSDFCTAMESFLCSKNFLACLQIQSISIIGHFMVRYDEYNRALAGKKNLPNCVIECGQAHMDPQYRAFLAEWCHFLQLGLSKEANGELDLIFWKCLGRNHFMSDFPMRYRSYLVGDSQLTTAAPSGRCVAYALTPHGADMFLCHLYHKKDDGSQDPADPIELVVERWLMDSPKGPHLIARSPISLPRDEAQLHIYCMPGTGRLAVMPSPKSALPPAPFALGAYGHCLRTGFYILAKNNDLLSSQFEVLENVPDNEYWEDTICCNGHLIVSRRRAPRAQAFMDAQKEEAHRRRLRKILEGVDHLSVVLGQKATVRFANGLGSSEDGIFDDDSDTLETDLRDSASELGSCGSVNDGNLSLDEEDLMSGSEDDNSKCLEDALIDCDGEDKDSKNASPEELKLITESDDSEETSSLDSLLSSDDEDGVSNTHDQQEPDGLEYPSIVGARSLSKICDICQEVCTHWYHCDLCPKAQIDLCQDCVDEGHWCLDRQHQLSEEDPAGRIAVRGYNNFYERHELRIYANLDTTPVLVFSHRGKETGMLLNSPPAMHPTLGLFAWPSCPKSILIAKIGEVRSQITHKTKPIDNKGRVIAINLSFSLCGTLLFAGVVEALRLPISRHPGRPSSGGVTIRYSMNARLIVIRLKFGDAGELKGSSTLLTREVPLGQWPCSSFLDVPFAWTWTDDAAHFAIGGLRLRVYRFRLERDAADGISDVVVEVPTKHLFLPRSSLDRCTHFYPATVPEGRSMVVLGPRYGSKTGDLPDGPLVIYLEPKDLGEWKHVADVNPEYFGGPKRRRTGNFEDFDTENDCDVIPFDLDGSDLAAYS